MQIAIVSDSHDHVANIEKAFKYFEANGIKTVIHAGDLSAPSMLPNVIVPHYTGDVYMIAGNVADRETMADRKNTWGEKIYYLGLSGEVNIDGKKILIIHEPVGLEEKAAKGYDVIVYGHTHQSETKKIGDAIVVNPGTLGSLFAESSFAIYDTGTDKITIKKLDEI